MSDITEGSAVPIAGYLAVTCGQTAAVAVGGKLFLVTATPPAQTERDEAAPGSGTITKTGPGKDDSPDDTTGSILDLLRQAQRADQTPFAVYGPGGRTMLRNDVLSSALPLVDLETASSVLGSTSLADCAEIAVLRSPGAVLHVPAEGVDDGQLRSLLNPRP